MSSTWCSSSWYWRRELCKSHSIHRAGGLWPRTVWRSGRISGSLKCRRICFRNITGVWHSIGWGLSVTYGVLHSHRIGTCAVPSFSRRKIVSTMTTGSVSAEADCPDLVRASSSTGKNFMHKNFKKCYSDRSVVDIDNDSFSLFKYSLR